MDAQTIRRAIHDIIRFNPADFFVTASPTGFLVRLASKSSQAILQPFQLIDASDKDGPKVRVVESTLLGEDPDGFSPGDKPPFIIPVTTGDIIFAGVTIDVSGEFPGDVTSRFLDVGPSVPMDDPSGGTFYMSIGNANVTIDEKTTQPNNLRYGPMDASFYRVWFAVPKIFGIAWAT